MIVGELRKVLLPFPKNFTSFALSFTKHVCSITPTYLFPAIDFRYSKVGGCRYLYVLPVAINKCDSMSESFDN